MSAERPLSARQVVVGVDGSAAGRDAARWAAADAATRGVDLHLVHVYSWPMPQLYFGAPVTGALAEPDSDELRASADALLEAVATQVEAAFPDLPVTTEVILGSTAQELLQLSRSALLVAVGSRGLGGFTGLLVGSVGTQLAAHAFCPVVVVHAAPKAGTEPLPQETPTTTTDPVVRTDLGRLTPRIVLGVDPPDESDAAIEFAFEEAALRGAELAVVHSWTTPDSTGPQTDVPRSYDQDEVSADELARLADRLAPWGEKFPSVAIRPTIRHSSPAPALIAESANADLLIVGSHGHGALHDLVLGSVSNAVLHAARCPVAIVPTRRHGGFHRR